MKTPEQSRLLALSLLGLLLFSPPLLLLFDRPGSHGFSLLAAIIFVIWALLILAAALILERSNEE
ncbi:hypothetical protein ADIMK_3171 [Marinobacterium lacunae]|uniref:Uncharacterized protein n=1 Tax=Marinobacterium lacunae TaxID=1232683 RepID=A0A081FVZ4_9GAMM|nr:hypothetical protein [Marinobacterium lacunae]KEA62699.1 hypothetical protein ADIMK_3171 [Marinobacterium lacunae]MBR9884804.1 hypothetical protein [Oceanospirillales bacterium]